MFGRLKVKLVQNRALRIAIEWLGIALMAFLTFIPRQLQTGTICVTKAANGRNGFTLLIGLFRSLFSFWAFSWLWFLQHWELGIHFLQQFWMRECWFSLQGYHSVLILSTLWCYFSICTVEIMIFITIMRICLSSILV